MKKFNTIMTTLFFTSFSDIAMRVARKKISLNHVWFVIMLMLVNIGSLYAQPTITSISPTSGLPGTTVTMTGTNLNAVTSVRMFGSSETPIVVLSSSATSLVVGIPHSATGSGTFYVENGGGNTSSPTYTVNAVATYPTVYGSAARRVLGQTDFGGSGSGVSQTRMYGPGSVFVDRVTGKVFVADEMNNRVLRFASYSSLTDGALAEAVFGQSSYTSVSTGGGAMNRPVGIYVDSQGNLWVADQVQCRILRFPNATTTTGTIPTGSNNAQILGQTSLTNISPAAGRNTFSSTKSVFIDEPTGTLWVADAGNHRILRFDNIYARFTNQFQQLDADGVFGQGDFTSVSFNVDGGSIKANGLRDPSSVCIDVNGRLFVADQTNNRVLWFDNARAKANGANADGVIGQSNLTTGQSNLGGDGPSARSLKQPSGVITDPNGRLWVSDGSNNRILRFTNPSNSVGNNLDADIVLGQAIFTTNNLGNGNGGIGSVTGVGLDASGRVYATDRNNNRTVIYDIPLPPSITSVSPTSSFAQSVFALTINGTDLSGVTAFSLQGTSLLPFVVSSSATQIIANVPASAISTAGTYTMTLTTPSGTTTSSVTITALSSATYSSTPTNPVSSIATLVLGQSTFTSTEFATGSQNGLRQPAYTIVAPSGKVFVADYGNHRVLRYANFASLGNGANAEMVFGQATYNTFASATTQTGLNNPYQIFVDENDMLWVADQINNRVLRFDNASTITYSANNPPQAAQVLGQSGFTTGASGTSQTALNNPTGVWAVGSGSSKRLFVADRNNHRVLRFDNVMAKGNGGAADVVLGQSTFTANTSAGSAGRMGSPIGVMVDADGTLWVTENSNRRVIGFDNATTATTGALSTRSVGADVGMAGAGGVTATTLNSPEHSFVAGSGNNRVLWVADGGTGNRILRFNNVATTNGGAASFVLGQSSFTTSAASSGTTGINSAMGVWVDASGRVWSSELNNNRVMVYNPLTLSLSSVAPVTASSGMDITLTGTGMNFGVSAVIASTPMTIVSSSATQLVVRIPNGLTVGTQTITLTSSLGTTTGSITLANNQGGTAMIFNGTSTYIDLGNFFNPSGSMTFEAWIRPTANTSGNIVSKWTAGQNASLYRLERTSDGQLYLSNVGGSGPQTANGSIPLNQWSHIAFTIAANNSGSNDVRLFINGELAASGSVSFNNTNTMSTFLGAVNGNPPGQFFTGQMDEVRFYNTVLTQATIRDNMYRSATSVQGVVGYYDFNQANGTTLNSAVGSITGTIVNGSFTPSEIPFATSTVTTANSTNLRSLIPGVSTATSGTMTLTASSAVASGGRVAFGHNGSENVYQTTDVPSGFSNRLMRVWRIETTTNPAPPTVSISFDVTGLSVGDGSGLSMLVSSSPNFAGVSGNQVVSGTYNSTTQRFTVSNVTLTSGSYYTLGNSPLLPAITNVSPTSAQRGDVITMTGVSLGNATVRFFGANGTLATLNNNTQTQVQAVVPNVVGSGAIYLQTTTGNTNSTTVTIVATPTLTAVAPTTLLAGQVATLTGTNLDLVTSITLNGNAVTIVDQSRTSITIRLPNVITTGAGTLSFSGTGGSGTFAVNSVGIPTITGLSQTAAGIGSNITITGTNLNQLTAVNFFGVNGTPATIVSSSVTQLVVTVPAGVSPVQGQILVQNQAGSASSPTFTIVLPPTITSISSLVTTTGQTLTITGTNLGNINSVRFFGTTGTVGLIQSQTLTQVVVTVPAGIIGQSGNITITNIAGSASSADLLTIVAPPIITAQSVREIIGGGTITLTGSNLDRVTSVRFFGSAGSLGTIVSQTPTQLVAIAPLSFTQRTGRVVVQNIAGSANSPQDVNAISLPAVSNVGPLPTYSGQILTITGTNFTGVNAVRFFGADGVTANIVSLSDTQLSVVVPRTALAGGQIALTNIAGTAFSSVIALLQAPQIASVPASARAGDTITITGSNFELLRSVRFFGLSGIPGTIISSTPSQIRVRVPVQNVTTASGQITVENVVGFGTAVETTRLFSAPIISALRVNDVSRTLVREGETVTVIGDNLDEVQAVRVFGINGTPIPFINVQPTSLQFVVPSGVYGQSGQVALVNPVGTGLTPTITVGRAPTISSIQPTLFSAGDTVVVAGVDLQFVTSVRFFGATGSVGRIVSQTGTSMFVVVPAGSGSGRIYAENALGNTLSPQNVGYRTTAPGQPTGLVVSNISASAATLTFTAPATGSAPTTFEVRLTPAGTITPNVVRFVSGTNSYSVQLSGLASGTRFTAEVRSVNEGGASAYASTLFETALLSGPPNVPTALRVEQASPTTARLAWNPASSGGTPSRYRLQWRWVVTPAVSGANPGTRDLTEVTVDRFSNTADFVGMNYTQTVTVPVRIAFFITIQQPRQVPVVYQFRVRAENAAFQSAYSDWITLNSPPNAPAAPVNVLAQDITSSSFIAQGNVVGEQLQSVTFNLYSSDNNFAQPIQTVTQARSTPGQVRQPFAGIRDGSQYYVEITARNLGGTSPAGRSANFRALPNTPGAPQLLTSNNLRSTSFDANWVVLRGLGGIPDGFEVQLASGDQSIDSGRVTQIVGASAVRNTFTGLNPELPYRWRVRAYNNNRTAFSTWSDILNVNLIDFRRRDSLALVRIFREGGGTSWTNSRNWNTTVPIDLWYGVVTDGGRVISLELGNNRLTALSPAVGQLSALRYLSVWGNSLTSLPDSIAFLRNLEEIEAHNNQITAFNVNLSGLNALTVLRLNGNRISSLGTNTFPASSALRVVRLDNNNFSGNFTQQIFNLNEVRIINLANNNITGFAGNVGKWLYLTNINLNRNQLTAVPNLSNNFLIRHYNVAQNRISANGLSVNASLNIPRVTYITDPQNVAIIAGQSTAQDDDVTDMQTMPNRSIVDPLAGVLKVDGSAAMRAYPLPARDELMLDIVMPQSGLLRMTITDNLGRVVREQALLIRGESVTTFKLDVGMLTAGQYTIALSNDLAMRQPLRTSFVIVR